MFIDSLVVIYKIYFFKSKLVDQNGADIDDVFALSPNHVSSFNNGTKYYISMNFKIL